MTVGSVPGRAPATDNSHVRVVVRVRPENQQESNGGYRLIVQVSFSSKRFTNFGSKIIKLELIYTDMY